jgi:hypothetical protein
MASRAAVPDLFTPEGENLIPVVFHAHDRPTIRWSGVGAAGVQCRERGPRNFGDEPLGTAATA